MEVDVQSYYHHLMDSYNSSDSDIPLSKQVCLCYVHVINFVLIY